MSLASFSPHFSHFQAQNIDSDGLDLENGETSIQVELQPSHRCQDPGMSRRCLFINILSLILFYHLEKCAVMNIEGAM